MELVNLLGDKLGKIVVQVVGKLFSQQKKKAEVQPETEKFKVDVSKVQEWEIVRPWTQVAPLLLEKIGGFRIYLDQYPYAAKLLMPWDFRHPIEGLDTYRDWRMILNLYMGLEMPFDADHPILDNSSGLGDELEYELVQNTPEEAYKASGFVGGGFDPLHNAILIVVGNAALIRSSSRRNIARCANMLYYMATGGCIGEEEAFERQLRQEDVSLQDAVKAVMEHFNIAHTASVEYHLFEHREVHIWD